MVINSFSSKRTIFLNQQKRLQTYQYSNRTQCRSGLHDPGQIFAHSKGHRIGLLWRCDDAQSAGPENRPQKGSSKGALYSSDENNKTIDETLNCIHDISYFYTNKYLIFLYCLCQFMQSYSKKVSLVYVLRSSMNS